MKEAEDDPGWSTSDLSASHQHHSQGSKRESVVAQSAHASKQWRNAGRKARRLKVFIPM